MKTLLLILNEPDKIFNASTCGDNCAKWILEIVHSMRELLPLASKYLNEMKQEYGRILRENCRKCICHQKW